MTSIVFPGQGSQYFGMCKEFYDNFKISQNLFNEIEEITSVPIKKIIFEDDSNNINLTKFTQICIFATSMSIFKVIEENIDLKNLKIKIMFGHSLGEYTALTAAKKISVKSAAELLKIRGELMSNAISSHLSGMVALIGLNSSDVERIIVDNKLDIYIANDNSPQQVVIAGMLKNLNNSKEIFLKNGVKKFVQLNVSAAFHCPIMLETQKTMQKFIEKTNFIDNQISILSNFNAEISEDNIKIKNSLINQMANKVKWRESIDSLSLTNDLKIVEVGPGKVLSGLIKRINNNFSVISINSINDLKLLNN